LDDADPAEETPNLKKNRDETIKIPSSLQQVREEIEKI
jgi:hypothetical protein